VAQILVRLVDLLDAAPPEAALGLVAPAEGQHHGQGHLALAEIVAHGLAQLGLLGGIVQHVVDELEGDAEVEAVAVEGLLLHLRALGDDGADAAGGREEGRGLAADDVEIGLLGGIGVVAGDELQHLALGDHRRGAGEDLQHPERPVGDHELEGPAEQEIAHQHAGLVAPQRIGGGKPAAQVALVHHIVVEQGAVWMNSTQAAKA
jgi:hypothetical protein